MSDCLLCERPIVDTAYACVVCGNAAARRLTAAAELYAEMAVQIARQVRYGDKVRLSDAQPMPFDMDASIDHGSVVNTITTWARHIAEERGQEPPSAGRNLMLWLADQTGWLRYRPEAGEALDELSYAARLVERSVDAPAVHWFAGRCLVQGCESELYARAGAGAIRCRDCGAEHDADERRAFLMGMAADVLGTATEIAGFVSQMRCDLVTSAQIRGLAFRGRIVAHGRDRHERPTYRVGDVLAVLTDGRLAT